MVGMDISVVIPLYNKRTTIARALLSIQRQRRQPAEIIVVNDGSTDGSEKVAEAMNVAGLRLIHQPNAGVSAARNRGIDEAKYDWIAFLDADDEWMEEYLQTIAGLNLRYPSCGVCATAYLLGDFSGNSKPVVLKKLPFDREGMLFNYFDVASCSSPPLWTSAVCVKKSSLAAVGGFPAGVRSGEDLLTWARLAAGNAIAYARQPLAVFWQGQPHTYDGRPNRIPDQDDPVGKGLRSLKAGMSGSIGGIDGYIALWHKMRASIYLRLDMRRSAVRECFMSLKCRPVNPAVAAYLLLCLFPKRVIHAVFKRFGNQG